MIFDESKLAAAASSYLERCRAGDWNHALRVVRWAKLLGEGREDLPLLITAAYVHDVGWCGVLPPGKLDLQEMLGHERTANANTEAFVREILRMLDYGEEDTKTVLRLVHAADRHRAESDDEAVLVDADSLSKLCIDHLREKYAENNFPALVALWESELAKRIRTQKAKQLYPALLERLKQDVEQCVR